MCGGWCLTAPARSEQIDPVGGMAQADGGPALKQKGDAAVKAPVSYRWRLSHPTPPHCPAAASAPTSAPAATRTGCGRACSTTGSGPRPPPRGTGRTSTAGWLATSSAWRRGTCKRSSARWGACLVTPIIGSVPETRAPPHSPELCCRRCGPPSLSPGAGSPWGSRRRSWARRRSRGGRRLTRSSPRRRRERPQSPSAAVSPRMSPPATRISARGCGVLLRWLGRLPPPAMQLRTVVADTQPPPHLPPSPRANRLPRQPAHGRERLHGHARRLPAVLRPGRRRRRGLRVQGSWASGSSPAPTASTSASTSIAPPTRCGWVSLLLSVPATRVFAASARRRAKVSETFPQRCMQRADDGRPPPLPPPLLTSADRAPGRPARRGEGAQRHVRHLPQQEGHRPDDLR